MINGGKKIFVVLSLFGIACVYQVFVRMYPYDTRHFTSNHNTLCDDDCAQSEDGHYRCNTNEGKDYCSPDSDVASNGKPCLEDHPCDQHGTNYHWCYTGKTAWDFCGLVDGSALGYIRGASHRRYKRTPCPTNYSGDHTCDGRKVFFEYECNEDKNKGILSGDNVGCILKVIEHFKVEKLPGINNSQESVVPETEDTECCIWFEKKYLSNNTITYYKLHVQDETKTKTYATVYVPSNETNYLKDETIRYAFNQSSQKKEKITMVIKYSAGSGERKRCRAAPETSDSTSSQTKPRKTTLLYLASVVMVSTFFL